MSKQAVKMDRAQWSKMEAALAELRAKLDAEQGRREIAELERDKLRAELAAINYAVHMPADYPFGLPTWINMLCDRDGRVIGDSEDVELMISLGRLLAEARLYFAVAKSFNFGIDSELPGIRAAQEGETR